MIQKSSIDQVLDAARVEEVIADFITLKRRGVNLLGNCPFHNEKTPSFTVSPVKGIYKCFGCGKAGNAVNFIMDHESLSYPDAIRWLAKKYNVELEESKPAAETIQADLERESILVANQFALKYFQTNLHESEEGKAIGLSYFKERGISLNSIKKFGLGYSFEKWDDLIQQAIAKGFNIDVLSKAGLAITENRDKPIDRYRGRVIFPIHSMSGQPIAFAGRILRNDPKMAKYINSPETTLYHKSKVLYGMHLAKKSIAEKSCCYLVEGYTDVISLHQQGIENVVASSGTSLTEEQIKLVKRFTPNVVMLYDGDAAGIKASLRGIDMVLEQGLNVKVVLFPEGHDPDSYSRSVSTAELEEFLKNKAEDFIHFKIRLLLAEVGDDPIKKAGLLRGIVESIVVIPDALIRQEYIRSCSELMKVEERVLILEINKLLRQKSNKPAQSNLPDIPPSENPDDSVPPDFLDDLDQVFKKDGEYQERDLLRLLMLYGDNLVNFETKDDQGQVHIDQYSVAEVLVGYIEADSFLAFEQPLFASIYQEIRHLVNEGIIPEVSHYLKHENKAIFELYIHFDTHAYELSENWQKMHQIAVNHEADAHVIKHALDNGFLIYKLRKVQGLIKENQEKLKVETDAEAQMNILQVLNRLEGVKKTLAKDLGMVIIK